VQVIGGTVPSNEKIRLNKLIFRATRGKALVQFYEIQISDQDKIQAAHILE